ncbi:MAG TPA: HesA/MoeB/ThiF family protein [Solirubrobacteraceae bacterium]|jgi:molybdopterin/thiamine biosynthesis adenylyltransferase|nr:HesA/MoeB/ThiF family protein [Solirubrobacteraceae bacterium]
MNDRRAFFRGLAGAAREPRPAEAAPADEVEAPVAGTPDLWLDRYSRQLVLPEWSEAAQRAVGEASVLVVGAGALGSPVATYLAGAGVGRLGIVDEGDVELSNLHRQHLHFTPDVGVPKAHSAAAKLGFLNPEVVIEPYQAGFNHTMVEAQDLVVDCTDSFATRYAVNAACCAAGVPLVQGGVTGLTGIVMAIRPQQTACYRCAFPTPPPPDARPSCAEAGVLGPAAGVVGSLQALEALKLLAGLPALTDAFLQIDLALLDFLRVAVGRREDCQDCSRRNL